MIVLTPRPGRIVLDRPVGFSRSLLTDERNMTALRAVKSTGEFVAVREELMGAILGSTDAPSPLAGGGH